MDINQLDINQFCYFISVAKHLSFTKAAQEHFISPLVLRQQITSLERLIGVKLIIYNENTILLTEAAKVLLPEAKCIVRKMDELIRKVQSMK